MVQFNGGTSVRELHVSRNTVRKILRSDQTDFSYERERQPLPKTGAWKAEIERFLAANEGKPSRERLTLIRIYEELRALGYDGSYDAIRRRMSKLVTDRGTRSPWIQDRSVLLSKVSVRRTTAR
jgi:transposase